MYSYSVSVWITTLEGESGILHEACGCKDSSIHAHVELRIDLWALSTMYSYIQSFDQAGVHMYAPNEPKPQYGVPHSYFYKRQLSTLTSASLANAFGDILGKMIPNYTKYSVGV